MIELVILLKFLMSPVSTMPLVLSRIIVEQITVYKVFLCILFNLSLLVLHDRILFYVINFMRIYLNLIADAHGMMSNHLDVYLSLFV